MTKLICFLALATVFLFGSCSNSNKKNVEHVTVDDGSRYNEIEAEYSEFSIPVGEENFGKLQVYIEKNSKDSLSMFGTIDTNSYQLTIVKYSDVYNNAKTDAVKDSIVWILGRIFYNGVVDQKHTVWFYVQRDHAFPFMVQTTDIENYKNTIKKTYNYLLAQAQ